MEKDLATLSQQAYHRSNWGDRVVRRFHGVKPQIPKSLENEINHLYQWFLVPITLWPFNIHEFLEAIMDLLEHRKKPTSEMTFLMSLLPPVPSETAIRVTVEHEKDVQNGRYEHMVAASASKFAATERALARNKAFQADWKQITKRFDVTAHEDHKGVIRRSQIPERNLRSDFSLVWGNKKLQFITIFDVFCLKWNLYGMRSGKPLLQKLSVNLTPFGTMIFIPSYWSLDAKRDLRWKPINALHKARVPHRQGKVLAEGAEQRHLDATKLIKLDTEAKALGLKGAKRHEFLCLGLGWDLRTDAKRLSRLRKLSEGI